MPVLDYDRVRSPVHLETLTTNNILTVSRVRFSEVKRLRSKMNFQTIKIFELIRLNYQNVNAGTNKQDHVVGLAKQNIIHGPLKK